MRKHHHKKRPEKIKKQNEEFESWCRQRTAARRFTRDARVQMPQIPQAEVKNTVVHNTNFNINKFKDDCTSSQTQTKKKDKFCKFTNRVKFGRAFNRAIKKHI